MIQLLENISEDLCIYSRSKLKFESCVLVRYKGSKFQDVTTLSFIAIV